MSNTNNTQAHVLSTAEGCAALYKSKGRCLRREDFPATPEGWTMWCDHRTRKHGKEIEEAKRNQEYWKSVRGGEHLQNAMSKVEELNRALAKAAELQKQVDELKAKANKS
jgi:hypothetical protein